MRKPCITAIAALLLSALPLRATDIHSIRTDVFLHRNGNAVVHQIWDVTIIGGTEWYIPVQNLGQRGIREFQVLENDREYESDGLSWDSSRTLEQKKFRCGMVDKGPDGVELCWGQGEPGRHVYDIIYIIDYLVQACDDEGNDAFIWQFLNDEWSASPQQVSMNIYNYADSTAVWTAGDGGNMGIWVFGCEADYKVEDGVAHIESTEPLRYENSLIVMMRFDKGIFDPLTTGKRSFEKMRDDAFVDSDYGLVEGGVQESLGSFLKLLLDAVLLIGGFLLSLLLVFAVIPALLVHYWMKLTGRRYKKSVFGTSKVTGWSRDIPFSGDLRVAYSLLSAGDRLTGANDLFSNLTGAYMLRWVHKGLVAAEADPGNKGRVNLRFTSPTPDGLVTDDSFELKLYRAARLAAGGNLVLESDEFRKWSERNYETVNKWPGIARSDGREVWEPLPFEERCKLAEFRNFLEDFTLADERGVPEVTLWENYLVYAQLFGIADKVSKNLEKLHPELYREYATRIHLSDAATTRAVLSSVRSSSSSLLYSARAESERIARLNKPKSSSSSSWLRSSGGGGHSSSGGGGGYSGGGHGGGSR